MTTFLSHAFCSADVKQLGGYAERCRKINTATTDVAPDVQAVITMSKLRQPHTKKHSPLFSGETIFKQLSSSSFGRFHVTIQGVKSYLPKSELELPKVIVIGGKSAGKSSLLENITKCSVYRDLCTKRPVKLQLKQVDASDEAFVHVLYHNERTVLKSTDAILDEVDRIMKPLSAIADDEIIIQIGQVVQLRSPGLDTSCVPLLLFVLSNISSLELAIMLHSLARHD